MVDKIYQYCQRCMRENKVLLRIIMQWKYDEHTEKWCLDCIMRESGPSEEGEQ